MLVYKRSLPISFDLHNYNFFNAVKLKSQQNRCYVFRGGQIRLAKVFFRLEENFFKHNQLVFHVKYNIQFLDFQKVSQRAKKFKTARRQKNLTLLLRYMVAYIWN